MIRTWKEQEPWLPFVVACAALGLALFYLQTHAQPSATLNDEITSQVGKQPCQDEDADRVANAMDPEEWACHERFMREAIAMVNHTLQTSLRAML